MFKFKRFDNTFHNFVSYFILSKNWLHLTLLRSPRRILSARRPVSSPNKKFQA